MFGPGIFFKGYGYIQMQTLVSIRYRRGARKAIGRIESKENKGIKNQSNGS